MANLFSTMRSAVTALDVLQKAASAAQNNVSNASTPGYARQRVILAARPYDADQQLAGGVTISRVVSARDEFAEQTVRKNASMLSAAEEKSRRLTILEGNFSLSDTSGISARMDEFFSAANAWSVAPQGMTEKTNVIAAASDVAESFRKTATSLQQSATDAETRIQSVLTRIGDLADRVRGYNREVYSGGIDKAGSSTTIYSDLEELSQFVDLQALSHEDGTITLLIGQETPLVSGDHRYNLSLAPDPTAPVAGLEGATPNVRIVDENGKDVSSTMRSGELGALLEFRNNTIPQLAGSPTDTGDLNRLAKAFADRVNAIFADGEPDPNNAVKMFSYSNLGSAAQSLTVPDSVTSSALSAANPAATTNKANARALALATLAHPENSSDKIDGLSFVGFFGSISANVGRASAEATQDVTTRRQLQAQALSARESISGVSLDQEAISLVSIQRAYEASSRMISILDELTKIAVNIGRS